VGIDSLSPAHAALTLCANSRGHPWTLNGFRASWRTLRLLLEKQKTTSMMNMLDKIEEPPVVEPEAVAWQDMTDEQRVEVIADDEVEVVEQIASVEQVAEIDEAVEVVERVAEAFQQLAPKAVKAPKAKATKAPKAVKPTVRKYVTLGTIFFSGSSIGLLLSVYKTRETNVQKVIDYKAAIAAGDCALPAEPLSKSLKEKIVALSIAIQSGCAVIKKKARSEPGFFSPIRPGIV
jgi:hypothetical protein